MDDKSSSTIPSNEEVIEDLTKDLENSCRTANANKTSTHAYDDSSDINSEASGDPWQSIGKETDCPDDDEPNVVPKDEPALDFVDEEALKDREVTLSEDDKQKLRAEAEVLKNEGNNLFRATEYSKAMLAYTEGLQTCPLEYDNDRAILYANRAAAKMKYIEDKDTAIADCTKAVDLNPKYLRAYLRRAQLYEETSKLDDALADFKKILELDPSHSEANHAVRRLPPLIEAANEKLKTEMLGKLKELGNLVLKPFGLSTNNFELQQDPNSGGYSVKFNQNSS